MLRSIGHNLTRLLSVSGREPRALFWPYAACVVALQFVAMPFLMMPVMLDSVARMQKFVADHPEFSTVDSGPDHYSVSIQGYHPELMPDLRGLIFGMGAITLLTVALLATAVARRLHDRGRTALIGLPPLLFLACGMVMMPRLFGGFASSPPDLSLFPLLFLNNLLYLVSLVVLVVQLASRGDEGANRFGPAAAG